MKPRVWRLEPGLWVSERPSFGFSKDEFVQRPHPTFESAVREALGRRHSIGTDAGRYEREW